MKIAINIVLVAVAIVLAIDILAEIDSSKVQQIKNNFTNEIPVGKNYTLVPKEYGLDTIKVSGVQTLLTLHDIDELFGTDREIYVFLAPDNSIIKTISNDKYKLLK